MLPVPATLCWQLTNGDQLSPKLFAVSMQMLAIGRRKLSTQSSLLAVKCTQSVGSSAAWSYCARLHGTSLASKEEEA